MDAGAMDRRIQLRRLQQITTATGEVQDVRITVATVWASRRAIKGNEALQAGQLASSADVMFRIRWRPNVSPIDEIIEGQDTYEVTGVHEIGRREGYEIHASYRPEAAARPV